MTKRLNSIYGVTIVLLAVMAVNLIGCSAYADGGMASNVNIKPSKYDKIESENILPLYTNYLNQSQVKALASQIKWLELSEGTDLGETIATSKDASGKASSLKIGSKFKVTLAKDYDVYFEVIKLQPFEASYVYKSRLKANGVKNSELKNYGYKTSKDIKYKNGKLIKSFKNTDKYDKNYYISEDKADSQKGEHAKVLLTHLNQQGFSNLKNTGLISDDFSKKQITFSPAEDGASVGVTFKITAKYKGLKTTLKPNIVVVDTEEAGQGEFIAFHSKGQPWELLGNVHKADAKQDELLTPYPNNLLINELNINKDNVKFWNSPDTVNAGLGSHFFGPVSTNISSSKKDMAFKGLPVLLTRATDEVSVYMSSKGAQSVMFGVVQLDEGDAPLSYGVASHTIRESLSNNNPYLGLRKPDFETHSTASMPYEKRHDWTWDDLISSGKLKSAKENRDESEMQIMGNVKHYPSFVVPTTSYTLPVSYNLAGNKAVYINAFVDFNNDGKFDPLTEGIGSSEKREPLKLTAGTTCNLEFKDIKLRASEIDRLGEQGISELGVRVRLALSKDEITKPYGVAYSGEVEDFKIPIEIKPKGKRVNTNSYMGNEQYLETDRLFKAYGKITSNNQQNQINKSKIKLVGAGSDGKVVVAGEGVYELIRRNKQVKFTPEHSFRGNAKGVVITAQDYNGNSTDWTAKGGNVNKHDNNMNAVYKPIIFKVKPVSSSADSTGFQGERQVSKTPLVFKPAKELQNITTEQDQNFALSKDNIQLVGEKSDYSEDENDVKAYSLRGDRVVGYYHIIASKNVGNGCKVKVSFTPVKDYTGKHYKGKVRPAKITCHDGYGQKAVARYQPIIIPVTFTGISDTSGAEVGEVQIGNPVFENIKYNKKEIYGLDDVRKADERFYLVEGGAEKLDQTIVDRSGHVIGEYNIDEETGIVTFVPNNNYIGTENSANVTAQGDKDGNYYIGSVPRAEIGVRNQNGDEAVAFYVPTVYEKEIHIESATTVGLQGKSQYHEFVLVSNSDNVTNKKYMLVDIDGSNKEIVEARAKNDLTKVIGKYSIDSDTGGVRFTPNADFVGLPEPAVIKVKAQIGGNTSAVHVAHASYMPRILPLSVKPTPSGETKLKGSSHKFAVAKLFENVDKVEYLVNAAGAKAEDVVLLYDSAKLVEKGLLKDAVEYKKSGQVVGRYTISDGFVKFETLKAFSGNPTPVEVKLFARIKGGKVVPIYETSSFIPKYYVKKPLGKTRERTETYGVARKYGVKLKLTDLFDKVKLDINDKIDASKLELNGDTLRFVDDGLRPILNKGKLAKEIKIFGKGRYIISKRGVKFLADENYYGAPEPVNLVIDDNLGNTSTKAVFMPNIVNEEVPRGKVYEKAAKGSVARLKGITAPLDKLFSRAKLANGKLGAEIKKSKVSILNEKNQKLKKLRIAGQGVYTVNKGGSVTFISEPSFTGSAHHAYIVVEDVFGNQSTYADFRPIVKEQSSVETIAETQRRPNSYRPLLAGKPERKTIDIEVFNMFENVPRNKQPERVTVILNTGQSYELRREYGFKRVIKDLPRKDQNGKPIVYKLDKVKEDGITDVVTGNQREGFTIISAIEGYSSGDPLDPVHTDTKIDIEVANVWANGENEEIRVDLHANGKKIDTVKLSEENNFEYSFVNVPRFDDDGDKIKYTITENTPKKYVTIVDGDVAKGFIIKHQKTPKGSLADEAEEEFEDDFADDFAEEYGDDADIFIDDDENDGEAGGDDFNDEDFEEVDEEDYEDLDIIDEEDDEFDEEDEPDFFDDDEKDEDEDEKPLPKTGDGMSPLHISILAFLLGVVFFVLAIVVRKRRYE